MVNIRDIRPGNLLIHKDFGVCLVMEVFKDVVHPERSTIQACDYNDYVREKPCSEWHHLWVDPTKIKEYEERIKEKERLRKEAIENRRAFAPDRRSSIEYTRHFLNNLFDSWSVRSGEKERLEIMSKSIKKATKDNKLCNSEERKEKLNEILEDIENIQIKKKRTRKSKPKDEQ